FMPSHAGLCFTRCSPRLLNLASRGVGVSSKKCIVPLRKSAARKPCKKVVKRRIDGLKVAAPHKARKMHEGSPCVEAEESRGLAPAESPVMRRSNRSTVWEVLEGRIVEICPTMGVMRLASCGVPIRRSRRLAGTAMTKRGNAATRQLYLVHEVVADYRKCLGYSLFMKDFPSCELKMLFERSFFHGSSMHCATLCVFEEEASKSRPVVLGSCLYRYDSVARDAMILLFATADELRFKRSRSTFSSRGQGFGRLLDRMLCVWLREHRECRSVYVEMQDETVAKFWAKLG
ncbi:hypothetical protein Pmar_PMAR000119, partial [Perkinsus marinus ATCC 50983]